MSSTEGETIDFRAPRSAEGRVEDWMCIVEAEMKKTNKYKLIKQQTDASGKIHVRLRVG